MKYRISSPFRRLGAFLIECFFHGLILIILPLSLIESLGSKLAFAVMGIYISYFAVLLYFWTRSTTIGKALLHMHVVDIDTWEPVGFFRIVLREIGGKIISFSCFNLGFIWILIDTNMQGWHDKITRCYVVDSDVLVQGRVHVKDYNPYVQG